jgi:hypothetical protein
MGTVLKSRLSPCNGLTRKIAEAGKSLGRLGISDAGKKS